MTVLSQLLIVAHSNVQVTGATMTRVYLATKLIDMYEISREYGSVVVRCGPIIQLY